MINRALLLLLLLNNLTFNININTKIKQFWQNFDHLQKCKFFITSNKQNIQ